MNNTSDSNSVYEMVKAFKKKYPETIAWRLKRHSKVIQKHLNPGEKVIYAFVGQHNDSLFNICSTNVFAITNKRMIIGTKRIFFGYFMHSITPDMFNDVRVSADMLYGKVEIDTLKEYIVITNLSKRSLQEIETAITEYVMHEKEISETLKNI